MPLQSITAIYGIAKQTGKGSIAANPTFAHGLTGGTPIKADPTQSILEATSGKRAQWNVYRDAVEAGSEIASMAYMKSLGLYLYGALGTIVTTGAGPTYTHTYATGDLPYLTAFLKGIDTTFEAVRDCKVDELSLKWSASKPVELSVKMMGTVFSYPATFTAGTDETATEAFLVPVGGTFNVDVTGQSPVSASVIGGELTIKNNITSILTSGSVEASDVFEGVQEHTLKLTIVPNDLSAFRKTVTGTANGSAVSSTVTTGSVALTFNENAGNGTLGVTGSKVAFLTAFPAGDPKGGRIEVELAGTPVVPSGGTAALVYALSNTQASY